MSRRWFKERHWKAGQPEIWAMIWRGHMTLLEPLEVESQAEVLSKFDVYTTPSLGFRYFWHQRHDQPRSATGNFSMQTLQAGQEGGSDGDPYGAEKGVLPGCCGNLCGRRPSRRCIMYGLPNELRTHRGCACESTLQAMG